MPSGSCAAIQPVHELVELLVDSLEEGAKIGEIGLEEIAVAGLCVQTAAQAADLIFVGINEGPEGHRPSNSQRSWGPTSLLPLRRPWEVWACSTMPRLKVGPFVRGSRRRGIS